MARRILKDFVSSRSGATIATTALSIFFVPAASVLTAPSRPNGPSTTASTVASSFLAAETIAAYSPVVETFSFTVSAGAMQATREYIDRCIREQQRLVIGGNVEDRHVTEKPAVGDKLEPGQCPPRWPNQRSM
jgi:hypothetical protein